jgi:hypothetical protein
MTLLTLTLLALAVEHATDILVNAEPLKNYRIAFQTAFPALYVLAECRFCLSFWISGLTVLFFPGLFGTDLVVDTVLTWLVLHKVSVLMIEATERFLGRAPMSVLMVKSE